MKRKQQLLLACVGAAVVGAAALAGYLLAQRGGAAVPVQRAAASASASAADSEGFGGTVQYGGKTYTRRQDLETVLFLGIDRSQDEKLGDTIGQNGRSDTMLLFLVDKTAKNVSMLEISRDTMADVDVYDNSGTYLYTANMQLTMQYTFGDSARRGCWLTKNKVSELLYDTPIDATVSLTMEGIAPAVDALGGVTLTIPADYTAIDPAFTQGATLTMTGGQAYRYVRYRDTGASGSNSDRMARQLQVLRALYAQLLLQSDRAAAVSALQAAAEPYLESDADAQTLQALAAYPLSDTVYTLPGENVSGELHDEYHIDETALQELVLRLFYTEVQR